MSELLKLHQKVKEKIQQSESILDLSLRFHETTKQLEALLQSNLPRSVTGSTGSCGSGEAELEVTRDQRQQIQNLLNSASTLKMDICNAIEQATWSKFRSEQLEARLLSLDSLCVSWINEASRREEELRRETRTRILNEDINQLRDAFKELKKRFSNLKFNFLKRNDRSRNMKAVRNQLQQVETYDEKLQALKRRLQGLTGRLGSEVKDGGIARETEDTVNELQRQMGEFERSVREHEKTLDMTCRLQQAMDEYQFWCDEASATIARVGKFSLECRSTEAVSVLYRQFEKFVWPTVPQQEERIGQITELSVRLHGLDEGRRHIEKTLSKHSEMVQSIRELSDGLMKLEAKLKLENLKQQQKDEETETNKDKENRE
ncbi:coiled-coil domain-containing protein 141-like, partial [Sphaeramia orbicularis]|uniref:coiled-coil domain-containing protein 141-like n=1 Tax=Sphaeramia orbicularis TaxID=375764 RepID=UPI001180867C